MYCPACPSETLARSPENTKVVDFSCDSCGAEFQLKSKHGRLSSKVRDAAYEPMIERVLANRSPHFAFLSYSSDTWSVTDLLLVPSQFITPSAIERCPPLSPGARRAGWVGCNILLRNVPTDGRVAAIAECATISPAKVRSAWSKYHWLSHQRAESRGWTADVLRCLRTLGKSEFVLSEMYGFEEELYALHPGNQNVRPKIRQQLQVLRDAGVIIFEGRGRYTIVQAMPAQGDTCGR